MRNLDGFCYCPAHPPIYYCDILRRLIFSLYKNYVNKKTNNISIVKYKKYRNINIINFIIHFLYYNN